ncbi:ArsR/SmtB family transcription factor [Bradymonas sediminis]|uniref:Uncharacterized protein n=1 Tax=Bradymonas sediminis TaxID=1548548 RepID=A0A2Z4FH02_9DELT|nr:helix-turn-helix domain-containing protein [Bradymonas sediminis]AWV88209.1 hypothetical protein DN745_02185 [Bradymonas sediminis]TDP77331.1 helix-turn-helix protein [Bradymonas sediminis]
MQDTFKIETPEQLKAMSDSRRLELVKQLVEQKMTVAQLAEAVGEDKSKLYYHLKELETHGLIEVVETRQKGNLLEKLYGASARHYTVDRSLFRHEHGMEMVSASVNSLLDSAAAEVNRLAVAGVDPAEVDAKLLQFHHLVRISPSRREEFGERIRALLEEFRVEELDDPQDLYTWTMVLCPRPDAD